LSPQLRVTTPASLDNHNGRAITRDRPNSMCSDEHGDRASNAQI
jgi:hypothetical protein